MSDHALEVLEFERVLDGVARRAASEAGQRRIRNMRPAIEAEGITRELARVAAALRFLEAAPSWGPDPLPEVGGELAQLGAEGAVLEPLGVHRIGLVLAASRRLAEEVSGHPGGYPELEALVLRLVELQELEEAIHRCVDDEGRVLDAASPALKRVRSQLKGAHSRIVRRLEKFMGTLSDRFIVPDASITIRDGRYVIPVRREGRGEVGGIVHDESQTGATLFVEPPMALEAMNELRDLEREEGREVRRVLGSMTARIAPHRDDLSGALDALVDFDTLHARARCARDWDATPPRVVSGPPAGLQLREARHPLLIEAAEGPVVPYDLTLEGHERCMVVSGPNTGGKSVFLKATGLISALAQSGVVPPVGEKTVLPVFTSFFADIGDEQSIAQNLSTFSAHLANLSSLLGEADSGSLVLIDEMGTGTDPAEGAALARSVLEELVARGATTIASSHLGELKQLDTEGSGIVNASLQFDSERMEPTYRLMKGRPGRSYGLAIARRLGFPGAVLDRADAYRDEGAARMEDVLSRLESQEREVERLLHELEVERARTERHRADVETREESLREAERTAEERAQSDAHKLLMAARSEVEESIEALKSAVEDGAAIEDAAREARSRVERAAGRARDATRKTGRSGKRDSGSAGLEEGDSVRIRATGAKGRIVELRGDRATIEAGALRFEVALADLEPIDLPDPPRRKGGWSGPTRGQVRTEVDLRGLRVADVTSEVQRVLDEAVLEDLEQLRIIHGKGTGALRARVSEILDADGRISGYRMGGPGEGGAGVTVVMLRG